MSSDIAALTPPDLPTPVRTRDPDALSAPDAGEVSFRDLWGDKEKGFSFSDLLDIVNPLQHLPVVGTLYRAITGDQIGLGPRLIGGALFGGPLGLVGGAAMAAAEQVVGEEPGNAMIAFARDLFGGEDDGTQLADKADKDGAATLGGTAPAAGADAAAIAPPALPAAAVAVAQRGNVGHPAHAQPRAFPAFPRVVPAAHGVTAPLRPSLGAMRDAPALPAAPRGAPVPSTASPGPRAESTDDAARKRIAAAIEEAQRAQAALLLASVTGAAPATPAAANPDEASSAPAGAAPADPFRHHPLMPPPGAPPQWVSKAMERALDKYQQARQLPRAAVPAPTTP